MGRRTNALRTFVLEIALAHVNKDKVEDAYQLDTVLETRRELIKAWGDYCRNFSVVPFARPFVG